MLMAISKDFPEHFSFAFKLDEIKGYHATLHL
jgi:hypothetical protein